MLQPGDRAPDLLARTEIVAFKLGHADADVRELLAVGEIDHVLERDVDGIEIATGLCSDWIAMT